MVELNHPASHLCLGLRKARVEGVQKLLVKNGVEESRLTATTNDGNLSDLGEKCVAIDRAATIEEAN